jgi:hypothetical protein
VKLNVCKPFAGHQIRRPDSCQAVVLKIWGDAKTRVENSSSDSEAECST